MRSVYFCFVLTLIYFQPLTAQKPSDQDCNTYIQTADSLFKSKAYIQARDFYYKAYYCDTDSINEKIKLCYKRSIESEAKHDCKSAELKLIEVKVNEYYSEGNYQKAKELYFRVNYLNPNDSIYNLKLKLCMHHTIFDTTYSSLYDKYIRVADSYFMVNKYCEAEVYYYEAMKLIPNAFYPEGMIWIIERRTNLIEVK